jgi:hypothetical protein
VDPEELQAASPAASAAAAKTARVLLGMAFSLLLGIIVSSFVRIPIF